MMQQLKYKNKLLEDNKCLCDYGISKEATIEIRVQTAGAIFVRYENENKNEKENEINHQFYSKTVNDLKNDICKAENNLKLFDLYQLYYEDKPLLDDNVNIYTDLWQNNKYASSHISMVLKKKNVMIQSNKKMQEDIKDDHEDDNEDDNNDHDMDIRDDSLDSFLSNLGLSEYSENFKSNGFATMNDLKLLKDEMIREDLEKMGVLKIAHKLKLLKAIRSLQ